MALAFGLTVLTMVYAVGHISGGHFNPAVTIGLWAGGRFRAGYSRLCDRPGDRRLAALAIAFIAQGQPGWVLADHGVAANGYGAHSPGHYALASGLLAEILATMFFLIVIMGRHRSARRPGSPASRSA